MWFWFISLALFAWLAKYYYKFTHGICKSNARLTNKVAIVTGANSGIGYETAKDLANRGAKVILACRDQTKGIAAIDAIIKETGNKEVYFQPLDLSSLASVRNFAKAIEAQETRLDILVNNAGTGKLDNSLTEDKLPIEMQVNHFGPFLLTVLLLPLLKSSGSSRIVNVSSVMHYFGNIDLDKIHLPAKNAFNHSRVYANSKLANILFTKELHQRLSGSRVTVNCLHPGAVNTEIFRNQPRFVRSIFRFFFKTPWEGAQTSIYLAVSEEVEGVSGKYFVDCEEATVSSKARNSLLATRLWERTETLVSRYME